MPMRFQVTGMELRHLKHFTALAECRNYSVAANQLSITQPSLTRSIQVMERSLGVQLFIRDSRSVQLTYHGDLVKKYSNKILSTVYSLESEIKVFSGKSSGKLIVGGGTLASSNILSELLTEFSRNNPSVVLELRTRDVSELHELLGKGELDLFVAETKVTELEKKEELNIINYCSSKGVVCCRPNHPLVHEENLYVPRLKDFPLSLPRATSGAIESQFGDLFDVNREAFCGLLRFEIFQSVSHLLFNTDMLGFMPEIIIKDYLDSGQLVILDVKELPYIPVNYGVIHLKSRTLSTAAQDFVDFIVEHSIN